MRSNIEEHYDEELGSAVPKGPRKLLPKMVERAKMGNKLGDRFCKCNTSGERVLPEALMPLKNQRSFVFDQ